MREIINVTRSSMPDFNEYIEEIRELWDTHWLTNMGVKHQKLQEQLEKYLNCKHVTLYTNGHLALEGILEAYDFKKGSEVITTPFTFASTTHAIYRKGLVPVFCDVDSQTYCIDVNKIEEQITEKTVAIMPVHVYGNMCDVNKIDAIAKEHGLKVIYDAAHAFGVKYKGVSSSNFGDASIYSFHATKVFNTIEGGAICFSDDSLVTVLNDLKNFGIHGPESHEYIGGNAKMNEFQAAMGICNLRHLESEIQKRAKVVQRYRNNLRGINGLRLCEEQDDVKSNYAYFPVMFEGYKLSRDEVCDKLAEHNFIARKYFYPITNEFQCYKSSLLNLQKTPIAKHLGDSVLTLPLYADIALETVDNICDIIKK